MRWHGSSEVLGQRLADLLGAEPQWRSLNGDKHWQLRTPCGAVINYWPSTGTLLCQGSPEAAAAMTQRLAVLLRVDATRAVAGQYEDENEWWETGL